MVVPKAKLLAKKKAEGGRAQEGPQGDVAAAWGDQMRNYVLNPYQIVRTSGPATRSATQQAVFDGDVDDFSRPASAGGAAPRRPRATRAAAARTTKSDADDKASSSRIGFCRPADETQPAATPGTCSMSPA